jgi:hypothetical protein
MNFTRQKLFDNAVNQIRKQGYRKSVGYDGKCALVSEDGYKCAIGASLPDDTPSHILKSRAIIIRLIQDKWVKDFFGEIEYSDLGFLDYLQLLHDRQYAGTSAHIWEKAFAKFADKFNLKLSYPS